MAQKLFRLNTHPSHSAAETERELGQRERERERERKERKERDKEQRRKTRRTKRATEEESENRKATGKITDYGEEKLRRYLYGCLHWEQSTRPPTALFNPLSARMVLPAIQFLHTASEHQTFCEEKNR